MGYEMLTAEQAFQGGSTAPSQATEDPHRFFLRHHRLYEVVIEREIERDPRNRYPDAEAALKALSALASERGKRWM